MKENTANDEDIVNNATNLNIENSQNIINNKNQNIDLVQNKISDNIKYTVIGNPKMENKINENFDYFSQKNKNSININQQLTAKFNALASREKHYKNNNNDSNDNYTNYDKKSEIILMIVKTKKKEKQSKRNSKN